MLLAPPIESHIDTIVYNEVSNNSLEIEKYHEVEHHKNDTDSDKKREHHHHCNVENLVNIFISMKNEINFVDLYQLKEAIIYYENPNYFSYLETVFQPPKYS